MYEILLKYTKYIEEKLKEISKEIIFEDNELYTKKYKKNIKFITVNKRNEIDIIEY
jgi:hypothetical protein